MEEDNMATEVMIKRRVKQGLQAKKLVPLILQMRALSMHQPGYISGTTLCNLERPEDCLVISRWESIDDWNKWFHSSQRAEMESKIETLTGKKTEYDVYAPMVPRTIAGEATHRQTECIINC
jgi:heme-degrading monooxygenase HmoA